MLDLGLSATELAAFTVAVNRIDPPKTDVFAALGYIPTPKQKLFHEATEFAVLFGGSLGGGKTKALTVDVIKACVRYPGLRVGAFRRTYGELKESLLAELAQLSFANALGARWIGNEYELRFPNGSVAMFRYAESLNDATRRQGGQYQLLAFDELTLTLPEVVSFLESRLRSGRADVPVLGIRASANPGGPGHGSVRKRFIDSTNYGRTVIRDERGRTVRFIPSRMEDNPHLNPEYEQDLLALPEVMRQALRDGNWDVFAGAMFPDLDHDRHVINPVELPASWRRYNGIDWGYTKPWSVLWAAVDEDGRVWIYRELYKAGVGEAAQAQMILAAESAGEQLTARYADDAMWATRGDAKPIADVYAENGVHLTPAGKGPGSRIAGWQRVHSYLADGPACPHHRALGWAVCPRVHIFPQVTELYRELRDLPHATKGDPEDADTTASDHACVIAGTLIATARGDVPVEQVTVGDLVMTRRGWCRVLAAGLTGVDRPLVTVTTSSGRSVTCTPNHPVWTETRGWVNADALRYSDRVVLWPAVSSPSNIEASPSVDTRTPNAGLTGCTSRRESVIGNVVSVGFTRKSGRPNTGRSRRAIMSTTKTRIRSTMSRATSSVSPVRTTAPSTLPRAVSFLRSSSHITPWPWSRRLSGTAAKRAGRGIANTASALGRGVSPAKSPVSGVGIGSAQKIANWIRDFVRISTVPMPGRPAAWTTRIVSALDAGRRSASTGTPRPVLAHAVVASVCDVGRADVYNLTVEGEPEFFANGVLVHNCDALRYLLINMGSEPRFHFPPDQSVVVTKVDPQATGPRPPQPLPQTIGGFPVLTGSSPWG